MSTVTFDPNGCETHPNTAFVESYLGGVGCLCFPDETFQFAENETPEIVYSPRLSEAELEKFCSENLSKYKKYFDDNSEAIDLGDDLPPIDRFWE